MQDSMEPVSNSGATNDSTPSSHQGSPDNSATHTFRCDRCPRAFTRRENLSRHAKTHSAPWAHRCQVCGKGFARSDSLSRHEASHERWAQQGRNPSPEADMSNKRRKVSYVDEVGSSSGSFGSPDQMASNTSMSLDLLSSAADSAHAQAFEPMPHNGNYRNSQQNTALVDLSSQHFEHSPQANFDQTGSYHSINPYRNLPNISMEDSQLISFDYSGFLLPGAGDGLGDLSYEWFSTDFYSAMHETGNEHPGSGDSSMGLTPLDHDPLLRPQDFVTNEVTARTTEKSSDSNESLDEHSVNRSGRISRSSSPPNEASEEDKWAFAWDPKSRAILHADPISISPDHPLRKQHNPRFDIEEATFAKLKKFLRPNPESLSNEQNLKLPSLSEVNIFIGLYFEHFSHRMPVLHHATLNINDDLPPPLIGALLVIGSIYSRLPNTRRFAIVLLDIVRWHLQLAIEYDNSLMRDANIMFAETLICYAGLWCGNKRAFELAEVLRATVVKHVRSAQFWRGDGKCSNKSSPTQQGKSSLNSRWREWVSKESQRRLFWLIYALDVQFTSLLYMPATLSMGEVRDLCCPCDEDFWLASTARHWKSLLGPALVPPSRVFSAAAVPFLWSHWDQSSRQPSNHLPILGLNDWSAFLVLVTLQSQMYSFSQERLFADSYFDDEDKDDDDDDDYDDKDEKEPTSLKGLRDTSPSPDHWQILRRRQFADSLSLWYSAYVLKPNKHDSHTTSIHFRHSSMTGHALAQILLDVPFPEVQDALGKNGKPGIASAMRKLNRWINIRPQIAEDSVLSAISSIAQFASKRVGPGASEQLIITLFLSNVIVWSFATIASSDRKEKLLDRLAKNEELWKNPQLAPIIRGLEFGESPDGIDDGKAKADVLRGILRSAASCLTQLGTWGAALNLALLLHWRSEMNVG